MDDDIGYLVEGEFAFVSYLPTGLKKGMHFLHQVTIGLVDPEWIFFTLEHIPDDEDMFMSLYGAPVIMYIVSTDDEARMIASPAEIGFFNNGEEIFSITDEIINVIINQNDGFMDLESDEDGEVVLLDGKVIISYLSELDGEEEES